MIIIGTVLILLGSLLLFKVKEPILALPGLYGLGCGFILVFMGLHKMGWLF